jgi:beta-mannanase
MASFENYIGKPLPVNAMFWGWDSPFPQTITGVQGKTLLIFWEPAFGFDQINNGSQDAYIADFAVGAKAYGYPVILAPFDEFNLNEAPWGNAVGTNTPQKFISAWQRVSNIFDANNATNVKFALAYNNVSIPSASYASFYPGDNYVDYVGIDGFNFGGQTFAQVFDSAINEAKTLNKPVWIFSTGSVGPKSQFITDLGRAGYPWIWFNKSPFNIDSESITAFKSILP